MYILGIVRPHLFHCLQGFLAGGLWLKMLILAPTSLEELH